MSYVTLNGAKIWYDIMGIGPPILLHPGYTGSKANLIGLAKTLKKNFKVILMEPRGTGQSEHTKAGYSLKGYAEDVISLLNYLNLSKTHFLGHSMGGGVGYLLGMKKKKRLNSLIFLAPIPSTGYEQKNLEAKLKKKYWQSGDICSMSNLLQKRTFKREMETKEWFDIRARIICSVSKGHIEKIALSMKKLNIKEDLKKIGIPSLFVCGAKDKLLKKNIEDHKQIDNSVIQILNNAGHDIALHEPKAIGILINKFVEGRFNKLDFKKGSNL